MTPKQIQRKRKSIEKRQDKLKEDLLQLQVECTHPNASKEYKGNTGNYDPSADCYWIEFRCPDCGKFWMIDQ